MLTADQHRAPAAVHRGDAEMPWADAGGGIELKVLMVRADEGLWVIRNRFAPGVVVQKHRHTGPVYGYTVSDAEIDGILQMDLNKENAGYDRFTADAG